MNRNFNLPPGTTAQDLERPLRDTAAMMDAFFERLDDRDRARRDDAVLRAAERRAEQERGGNPNAGARQAFPRGRWT